MKKQTLSSLLDGELAADEVELALDRILADRELQSSWHTQHILRAVIQDDRTQTCCHIVDKVAAVVAKEPAIVAPYNLNTANSSEIEMPENVVAIRSNRKKILAFAAIAASFAVIVMVSYSPDKVSTPRMVDVTNESTPSMAAEQELQSMIVQHGEFSGAAALNGLVAYAKVVNGTTAGKAR
jgi:negative regulator of sigma E activity